MSTASGWKPTLRYSPVNGIICDFGIGNEPFSMCCMPKPKCETPTPVPTPDPDCPCGDEQIVEAVDTYDWFRWVPEIIVGIEDASEDMAASYARRSAREFATKARVLKRQITITLQPGVTRYPLFPFDDEQVQGVTSIESAMGPCGCESCSSGINIGEVAVNVASQELRITPNRGSCGCHVHGTTGPKHLLVTVWVAPTEDSCKHDVFLYEQYRSQITLGARAEFIGEAHSMGSYKTQRGYANYRGDQMMFQRAERMKQEFIVAMRKARVAADTDNAITVGQPAMLFGANGCCATGRH
jgi:hypothetical protein